MKILIVILNKTFLKVIVRGGYAWKNIILFVNFLNKFVKYIIIVINELYSEYIKAQ